MKKYSEMKFLALFSMCMSSIISKNYKKILKAQFKLVTVAQQPFPPFSDKADTEHAQWSQSQVSKSGKDGNRFLSIYLFMYFPPQAVKLLAL